MLILPALVFVSVTLGLAGLFFWLAPNKTQRRLQSMNETGDKPEWIETVTSIVGPFAKLSTPDGDWDKSPLKRRFAHAGIRVKDAQLVYFGAKTLLPLLFAGIAYVLLAPGMGLEMPLLFCLALAALFGCYVPNMCLNWMIRRRQREILESFPDAADLMLVCVEAGLGMDAALAKVAEEIGMKSVALAQELHLTNLEMRVGSARGKALSNLAARTGVEEINTFSTMLIQADRFGTSVGESLRVFSDELRLKRQVRAEEAAAKVPVKMLFPLVVCIFPSIIMVILGPAGIQIMRTLLPLISSNGG